MTTNVTSPWLTDCRHCERRVLIMRNDRGTLMSFIPRDDPGGPYAVLEGVAVWNPQRSVLTRHRLMPHHCRPTDCRYCGERVLIWNQPPQEGERLVVVDAEPTYGPGRWSLDELGYAIRDPNVGWGHFWHTFHVNPNRAR